MPKVIGRDIIIPKMSREAMEHMRDAACNQEIVDCRGLTCKNCMYDIRNFEHFIRFFDLDELQGAITVRELIEEEGKYVH